MTNPGWWSQPFPPTGTITSEGIRNQLGRPPVDGLTVFVRETAQNSWDARTGAGPVTYRLDLSTVSPSHRPRWQELLSRGAGSSRVPVAEALRRPGLRLLSVIDRGTKGLGGPTRADVTSGPQRDWVSFVLNVGERRDISGGGGTYGYGKAVLYRLSSVGTILVYTRVREGSALPVSRLIGIALGESFETGTDGDGTPFTGRHWWGKVARDHVEPLAGREADDVALQLGLAPFAEDETGTTLVVVAPNLDDFEGESEAAAHLADTVAWHLWPIMLPERGNDRLFPEVIVSGQKIPVPDPAETYPLDMFVQAYRRLSGSAAELLKCGRPPRELGRLALTQRLVVGDAKASKAADSAHVPGDPHHICLLRSPELVVCYHEGRKPVSTNLAYAGVFQALDDLDGVLAASEPPTHDTWVKEQLEGNDRTYVSTIFKRLREYLDLNILRPKPASATSSNVSLGALGQFLRGLVAAADPTIDPTSAPRDGTGKGGSSSPRGGDTRGAATTRHRRATPLTEICVEEFADGVALVQQFRVTAVGPLKMVAKLSVVTGEGKAEDDPPTGAPRPQVIGWGVRNGTFHDTDTCHVNGPCDVELWVRPADDSVTDVAVVFEPAGGRP